MLKPTHIGRLRCRTWHTWPEQKGFTSRTLVLALDDGREVRASIALFTYVNRPAAQDFGNYPLEVGPLLWRGQIPKLYIVRGSILKAPEDEVYVEMETEHPRMGEVDIAVGAILEGDLTDELAEDLQQIALSAASFINLRLGDVLTPVAPFQISRITDTGREFSSEIKMQILHRATLEQPDVQRALDEYFSLLPLGKPGARIRTALELYGGHFVERSLSTRFLLLVMVLEALATPTKKDPAALALIEKWKTDVSALKEQTAKSSDEWLSLDALEREILFRSSDSIRSQIRKLVQRAAAVRSDPNPSALARRALAVYDSRSKLVHEGTLPADKLSGIEQEAFEIAQFVLLAALESPVRVLDDEASPGNTT